MLMLTGVSVFIVCMPLGKFFFSVSAITCCIGLFAMLFLLGPRSLAVTHFPFRWLLLAVLAWFAIKIFWSINPGAGLHPFYHALYKGFAFLLVGMEIGKKRKYLLLLPILFLVVALYQGLDGVWQFYTGKDLIHGTPLQDGRLTGSLNSPRVGNFIAMVMIPVLALPWLLSPRLKKWWRWALTFCFLAPPMFLLIFSLTRTGYICLIISICALFAINIRFSRKIFILAIIPIILALALVFLHPDRFTLATLASDGRIELWTFALEIFKTYPITGSGLYTFNEAFHSLGLVPVVNNPSIPHPHNIYLQLLCETGIIGFMLFSALLLGILCWSGRIVRANLKNNQDASRWITAAVFWAAGVGYMAMSLTAHDLLRDWWFSLAWLQLGFLCGACIQNPTISTEKAILNGHND